MDFNSKSRSGELVGYAHHGFQFEPGDAKETEGHPLKHLPSRYLYIMYNTVYKWTETM